MDRRPSGSGQYDPRYTNKDVDYRACTHCRRAMDTLETKNNHWKRTDDSTDTHASDSTKNKACSAHSAQSKAMAGRQAHTDTPHTTQARQPDGLDALLPPPPASIPFPFSFSPSSKQQQQRKQIIPNGFIENHKSQSRSSQSQLLPCPAILTRRRPPLPISLLIASQPFRYVPSPASRVALLPP